MNLLPVNYVLANLMMLLDKLIPEPSPEARLARIERRLRQFGETMPDKRKARLESRAETLRRQINE